MRRVGVLFCRSAFAAVGFHYVRIRGKRASRKEAPILVAAPHTSFFDTFPVTVLGAPSTVSASSYADAPIVGSMNNE